MRCWIIVGIILGSIGLSGCRERSALPPTDLPPSTPSEVTTIASTSSEPLAILDRMVAAYQSALSYSDRATVQIIGKMSQPGVKPVPRNCSVAFQKPNRLSLEVHKGVFVSDGEDCYAQIRLLPHQVLHFSSPEQWTLETLFQDIHLDAAMKLELPPSVLRFPPQLVLLFANNPLNTLCPRGAKVEWIEQQKIGTIPCDVIQVRYSDGNRILWISQENQALLRLEYQPVGLPVPEDFESVDAIRIEMTDARFDGNFVPETFQMLFSQDAVQVAEFHSDLFESPASEAHRHRLKLMADNDLYRLIDPQSATLSEPSPPPKVTPRAFTLSPVWTHSLAGVDTMAWLPGDTPKLFVPCEGNLVAILDLRGNILQRIAPKGLEESIIMNIQAVHFRSEQRRIGIITLEGQFFLFDESFVPLSVYNVESVENEKETVSDFRFIQHHNREWLLLGIQRHPATENASASSLIRAVDLLGAERWDHPFAGMLHQVSSAWVNDQQRVLVSLTASEDSIAILSPDGTVLDTVEIPFGRQVIWLQVLGSTIYTLWAYTETDDVRFVGLQKEEGRWKAKWSRLLPAGDYEVEPVFAPGEQKWLVPSPNGEIFVFDLVGNEYGTFSLNVVPTGLLCVEVDGETLLFVASGETVSAWKIGKM